MSDKEKLKKLYIALKKSQEKLATLQAARQEPVAIVGMACRFPGGANNPAAFWHILKQGTDTITQVPPSRWDADAYHDPDPGARGKMYVDKGGFIDTPIDLFDPFFFKISPREAHGLDPQHRLLLEVSWEALENAAIDVSKLEGSKTGVFIGISTNDYVLAHGGVNDPARIDAYSVTGEADNIAAGRISYTYGLQGPCLVLDTACSSSLVALHLASQSLKSGESDLALVGGVNVILAPVMYVYFAKLRALSPDGKCKTFDASADGYARGEGCGMVVLKRLADAERDGDQILAVVKGTAVNHDGKSSGLTAPNGIAQRKVIRQALENAGVSPGEVDYVEAHGTGTPLGDPIEIESLGNELKTAYSKADPLLVGSVKTNIGHLEAAAGVASLIKVILSLQHKEIPPSLHFEQPNPYIPWDELPIKVVTQRTPWPKPSEPRIAGISSFGFSGTNAHVIVEQAPEPQISHPESAVERPLHLLALSAKTEEALDQLAARYAEHASAHPEQNLGDVCFSANTGRARFAHRLSVAAASSSELCEKLSAEHKVKGVRRGQVRDNDQSKIAFLFSGMGIQYEGMGRELYETQPAFRQTLERCDDILRPHLDTPLLSALYPRKAPDTAPVSPFARLRRDRQPPTPSGPLNETVTSHAALFALEYALAELWRSWGIEPDVVMGHSIGEYAAACVAGVFDLEHGLELVVERARLMQELTPEGNMTTVFGDETKVKAAIQPFSSSVSIAAINGPQVFLISGASQPLQAAVAVLHAQGIRTVDLQVSRAFHSPLVEPALETFGQIVSRTPLSAPKIKLLSNVTGGLVSSELTEPDYWQRHLRQPVRFVQSMQALHQQGYDLLLETGPDPMLLGLDQALPKGIGADLDAPVQWLPSLRQGRSDWEQMLHSLSALYVHGVRVDWAAFERGYTRRKVTLPNYPFQRKRYWVEQTPTSGELQQAGPQPPHSTPSNKKEDAFMNRKKSPEPSETASRDEVLLTLRSLMADLLQASPDEVDMHIPLLEMGANSLMLMEATRAIRSSFGVEIAIPQFFQDLNNLTALATFIAQNLPQDWGLEEPARYEKPVAPLTLLAGGGAQQIALPGGLSGEAGSDLERILAQQLETVSQALSQVVSQQLEFLESQGVSAKPKAPPDAPYPPPRPARQKPQAASAIAASLPSAQSGKAGRAGLDPRQQRHLDEFRARYIQRTRTSKQLAQKYRSVLAENRAVSGFRPSTKEMLYLIVAERSQGSRVWDVDGNEYIDIAMGFGVHLFGHSPPFTSQAIERQTGQGVQLALQTELAGEVAQLVSELTGMERVAFGASGTEVVMTAMRLARTKTRRSKVAMFVGSYHGHFDGVLGIRSLGGSDPKATPVVPGVPQNMVDDLLVLDYGEPESLQIIRDRAHELAAVLVEPVQSRRPGLQPREFLHQLRELTSELGIALIFDEMITGFRIAAGGAQEWFGVQADIATYGKVIGGGLPIGIIAGKADYMDCLDGGVWAYGDDSYPRSEMTFFASTFSCYPLVMATTQAVLQHIRQQGPAMYEQLNARTERLAETLNAYFHHNQVPIRIAHCGSLFRFVIKGDLELLFYHLLEKGVYTWEGRTCFLSTAHSDEDVDAIIRAVQESVEELRAGGFLAQADSPSAHTFSLSQAQRQLWVLTKLDVEGWLAYNLYITLQLRGPLRLEAMRRAVQQVVDRHEALRTTIGEAGNMQQVLPSLKVNVPLVDFSDWQGKEREAEDGWHPQVNEWFKAESQQPFDLAQGQIFRVHVLKLENELHLLTITSHHILVDGWSTGVILRDLANLYAAECQGNICQLEPAAQFRGYLQRQEVQSQTDEMAAHRAYWLEQLAGSIPVLNLPSDRPRPPLKTYRGARQSTRLGAGLYRELERVSREQTCTLFMTLFASYTALLHRLSDQNEIIVGIPVLGRSTESNRSLVGYCTHLLPIHSRLVGAPTFSEHLGAIRKVLLNAYNHQDYSFAGLLDDLNVRRDASRAPVIATTFNMDQPMVMPDMPGIELELYSRPISFTHFDLSLNITEFVDELVVECDYNTDLFDAATITRLLEHFGILLEGIVAPPSPGQKVANLPLLTEAERHQILVEWNDTQAEFPRDECIHRLIEAQAEQTPDAVAVAFQDQHLTYRELNARANQLAHYLQGLGVGPEVLVGICVERSLEMVVGLLGIIKAGGAYVPLDPTYPSERLNFMLEDTGTPILLTRERLVKGLAGHSARVVCLDTDWETIAQESEENLIGGATPDNLVYVIYTSGSTGKPKGVLVTHRNLRRVIHTHITFHPGQVTGFLLLSSFAFDSSVPGIFWTLCQGGVLVLPPEDLQPNLAHLLSLIAQYRVSHLIGIPSFYNLILSHADPQQLAGIDVVIVAGETCPRELVERHNEQLPHTSLFNEYGPTEGTIWCSAYPCQNLEPGTQVPIGRPIDNVTVYLLDAHLQPVPVGVPGELYIGGAGVTRGYLNRPELTAKSFIPDPFGDEPGARLYKTGDLARYLPDGNLDFLGRIDHQVKVRGFRIELGEIEAVLREHPALQDVVVLARVDGDKQLVAYVTTDREPAPNVSELRSFLMGKLPEYMVPSAFVTLETLPLTPNGKVDRRALPAPDGTRPELEAAFVMPQTEVEQSVATLWQQALKVDKVGIHDNFFDLGGNSLLMVEVHTQLQKMFEKDVPIVEMFRYPTTSALAEYLTREPGDRPSLQKSRDRASKQKEAMRRRTQRMRTISRKS